MCFYSRQLCFRLFLTVTSEGSHIAQFSVGPWTTIQCCAINSLSARYTSHRSHIAQSSVGLWTTIQCCPIPLLVVYRNYVIYKMRTLPEVRHSRTLPAALFPAVVLVVFLNFHWLILFPRTLISLLVKVLLFCHYRSRQFFIKCQKAPNRCCGLMMRKPKLAMFKSVCKCQTSSASSQ